MKNEERAGKEIRGAFYDISRKVLLAAIGAAVLAQDEAEGFVNRLVERGEMAEKDARKLVQELLERRESLEKERQARREQSKPREAATRADVEALSARIAELNAKIEQLRKEKEV
ncbi:MAG: poly(hydroxyalkanoate) granule-associated protein [Anaerolineaceae bacterium]|nr:poly(hydroxyalkanoate) granule-associated protein [Anaerolineaceae bacterium]